MLQFGTRAEGLFDVNLPTDFFRKFHFVTA